MRSSATIHALALLQVGIPRPRSCLRTGCDGGACVCWRGGLGMGRRRAVLWGHCTSTSTSNQYYCRTTVLEIIRLSNGPSMRMVPLVLARAGTQPPEGGGPGLLHSGTRWSAHRVVRPLDGKITCHGSQAGLRGHRAGSDDEASAALGLVV